jgi:hypothetical protein
MTLFVLGLLLLVFGAWFLVKGRNDFHTALAFLDFTVGGGLIALALILD